MRSPGRRSCSCTSRTPSRRWRLSRRCRRCSSGAAASPPCCHRVRRAAVRQAVRDLSHAASVSRGARNDPRGAAPSPGQDRDPGDGHRTGVRPRRRRLADVVAVDERPDPLVLGIGRRGESARPTAALPLRRLPPVRKHNFKTVRRLGTKRSGIFLDGIHFGYQGGQVRSLLSLISYLGSGQYRERYLGVKIPRPTCRSISSSRRAVRRRIGRPPSRRGDRGPGERSHLNDPAASASGGASCGRSPADARAPGRSGSRWAPRAATPSARLVSPARRISRGRSPSSATASSAHDPGGRHPDWFESGCPSPRGDGIHAHDRDANPLAVPGTFRETPRRGAPARASRADLAAACPGSRWWIFSSVLSRAFDSSIIPFLGSSRCRGRH